MSTQLTISIELITYMKWLLSHKREELTTFMRGTMTHDIEKELINLASQSNPESATDDLYEALSGFITALEDDLQSVVNPQGILPRRVKKSASRHSSPRRHAKNCVMREPSVNEDIQSIQSPTQRLLYQALKDSSKSDSNVH